MADKGNLPVFLERRSDRRRRMMDAVRLVPILGAMLWMLPLLWLDDPSGGAQTNLSFAIAYVFWVWLGLIVVSAVLWRWTKDTASPTEAPEGDG